MLWELTLEQGRLVDAIDRSADVVIQRGKKDAAWPGLTVGYSSQFEQDLAEIEGNRLGLGVRAGVPDEPGDKAHGVAFAFNAGEHRAMPKVLHKEVDEIPGFLQLLIPSSHAILSILFGVNNRMFEGQGRTVLLVEDEAIIALNEKLTLEKRGLHVQVAHTADNAIHAAGTCKDIDLVLMDIDLGNGMDGTEVATRILETRDVPIVFLTSHAEQEMVRKVKGITRYGYVLKNAGEFVLSEAIQTAFELFDAHERLKKSEQKYRTMVETAPMPFQSLDAEGRLIDVNTAWLKTLGYEREEILGTWFGDLLPADQKELFRERFPLFKARGHIEKVDFCLRRSDGTFVDTIFNGCIAYQDDGAFSHTVCIFHVVSPEGGE